jgi:hypothetical protein
MAAFVEGFDPQMVSAREAAELVDILSTIDHLAAAGLAQAGNRVAGTDLWRRDGATSAAAWLAQRTGTTTGEAVGLLKVGRAVEHAPDTLDALRKGAVSTSQAGPIAEVEKVAPDQAAPLIEKATSTPTSVPEIRQEAAQIINGASGETDADKRRRWQKVRHLRSGTTFDGMGWGRWELPPLEHAEVMSFVRERAERLFQKARAEGRHEPPEAYAADALHQLASYARRCGAHADLGTADETGPADHIRPAMVPEVDDRWEAAKVIVKIDLGALLRGEVLPGEVCEIAGQGPIAVDDAWQAAEGGAFVAAVLTRGTTIERLYHFGRRPTALQRTGLEWFHGLQCSIDGCTSSARLEADHVAEWASTRITDLGDLTLACGLHHDMKTYQGFRFSEPMANGKRRLIPPDANGPPGDIDAPPTSGPPRHRNGERRRPARSSPAHAGTSVGPDQPDLFGSTSARRRAPDHVHITGPHVGPLLDPRSGRHGQRRGEGVAAR